MDKHAVSILEAAELWGWSVPPGMQCLESHEEKGTKFKDASRKLLSGFIVESHQLGGTLLDRFWMVVEGCHPKLKENVKELRRTEITPLDKDELECLLFDGVDRNTTDFSPVFELSAELFTHLGVAFLNSKGHTHCSAAALHVGGRSASSNHNEETMKVLALKRDGTSCPLTRTPFFDCNNADPVLTHVVPMSVLEKPDTLDYIGILAGDKAKDLVLENVSGIGNVMNIELHAATAYQRVQWGVEASMQEDGAAAYIFRDIPKNPELEMGKFLLRDGEEIAFGNGPETVARVLYKSGAAEVISDLMLKADDTNFPRVDGTRPKHEEFAEILDAKLLISGRALVF